MKSIIEVGTARAEQHQIVYGSLDALELPSGGWDRFPIIIAQGSANGPVLWLTANIHGAEYTGIPVIHQLLNDALVKSMHGTIIAVPSLNPAGLRNMQRSPYYLYGQDPNRLFPAPPTKQKVERGEEPPSALEEAYQRLFNIITGTGSFLIDLHNYPIGSLSFAFRDPIYYRGGRDKAASQALQDRTGEMLNAFGHTIINEFASADYLKMNLHRSVSGSALNVGRMPAFTAELGGWLTVDPAMVKAAIAGIRNVMRWANMLDGDPEPITGIKILNPDHPIRRAQHPFAPHGGFCTVYVKAGDPVAIGDSIARITDIYGRPLGEHDGIVRSEYDGTVLGVVPGGIVYKNEPLLSLAIRDENDLVLPFPS